MQYQIYNLNCIDVLSLYLEDNSVDAIVTDPPYGLSFMGKKWDYDVPSEAIWRECLRVLKPGGHLLAFAGTRTQHRMAVRIEDAGFEIRDVVAWMYGSGFPKSHNGPWGGTALKPSFEPVTLARKPLIGTVADNVLAHGTGGLNIDGCRVATDDNLNSGAYSNGSKDLSNATSYATGVNAGEFVQPTGRWPANLIHDGSDEVLGCFPDAKGQQGDLKETGRPRPSSGKFGDMPPPHAHPARIESDTSAARFFYCAKASKKDRDEGNQHPTVKPTDLMAYLCRLVTPPGGIVLDPFMGSGSTGKAALREGFRFIGVERETEYCAIAEARLRAVV